MLGVNASVSAQMYALGQLTSSEEHEIVQRHEMGIKPPITYGYLESEENAVSNVSVVTSLDSSAGL